MSADDCCPISQIPNALTVDVEDYFHVSAFADRVCRHDWDRYECRVETSTDRLLSLFDAEQVRGTFFVLGWVAERYPALIRRIADAGHEIASHGYWHQLVYDLTPEAFAKDIADSKEAIADACGVVVTAYRAPSFSITEKSLWALDILAEHGFETDSSIFPISGHDRYGMATAQKEIHEIQTEHGPIREFPPSAWSTGRVHVPVGGGYFRLFPLRLTSQAINAVRREGRPAMFYTHPWEIDADQPRIKQINKRSRFRHYVGLKRTENRLRRLCSTHRFGPMAAVIESVTSHEVNRPERPPAAPAPEKPHESIL
ncbi:XrtA system polysaccharide deacetylase [Novipirellula artificiosorum]|uniref:Peptidoglycan deacetylase n=1 Tax=Novipirellula artificiosorum TaxID=2528016 RepID=A0A5C6CVZ2_9BACT|nr:XrtA system polysaccharide deacetylase [Novipirellula artificiosorum]TWU29133.1 Peptidoglycan deacetylase [Novipirellula artificiosorum]